MDNQNAVPAAVNVAALVSFLREKATREEREAVFLVMSRAEYYADRLAATPEQERQKLQREIQEEVANTYYIFADGSELRTNRYGEDEITFVANGAEVANNKSAAA